MARLTRRHFLRGAGAAAIAIPFLPSLAGRARAAEGDPKRFIAIYLPNNDTVDFPTADASGRPNLVGSYHEALSGYEDRMLIVRGTTDYQGHYPGHAGAISGGLQSMEDPTPGSESLDQLIKRRETEATGFTARSLHAHLGSADNVGGPNDTLSCTQSGILVYPSVEPIQMFDQMIGAYAGTEPSDPTPTTDPRLLRRASLLDGVREDYRRLNARLSPSDRRLLDAHLTMLDERHRDAQRLAEGGGPRPVDCSAPPRPAGPHAYTYPGVPASGLYNESEYHVDRALVDEKAEVFLDLIASGLVCGAASSATFMFGSGGGTVLPAHLQEQIAAAGYGNDHDVAHETAQVAAAQEVHFSIRAWQSQKIRYLLDRLDVPDASGASVLDSSLVMIVSELGIQPAGIANTHTRGDVGVVLVGGGHDGYLSTGHYLDLGGEVPYGDLLLTVAHAMGYEDLSSYGRAEDVVDFGGAGYLPNQGYGTRLIDEMRR